MYHIIQYKIKKYSIKQKYFDNENNQIYGIANYCIHTVYNVMQIFYIIYFIVIIYKYYWGPN